MRRHACIRCGDRIMDVPQFTAEGEYLCRNCFQQLFFENGDLREEPIDEGWRQWVG